ncbi:MAG: Unknown protein [uncultured Thiotrichaceae bacterium]|uniref:Uncharacterized protein n=1 Tax=uncultured Thiotrichaceae bacterium TaxID=298394 RepID=A0A6S6SWH1_9GAMM|nr:MAG: Unknown protein [uncultured Thiotrichaceae bacterium]
MKLQYRNSFVLMSLFLFDSPSPAENDVSGVLGKFLLQAKTATDEKIIESFNALGELRQRSVIVYFASSGETNLVKKLLATGLSIDCSSRGLTPLNAAAIAGRLDMVKMLLGGGASTELRDQEQDTPLKNAAREGHLDIVKALIKHGADVNAYGKSFTTPYTSASYSGHKRVMEVLEAAGANVFHQQKMLA